MKERPKKQRVQQKKYYFIFPQDENSLIFNAVSIGALEALRDWPNILTQESIKEKAKASCDCWVSVEYMTNDFDRFQKIFIDSFIEAYKRKQENFKQDISMYEKDIKQVEQWGGFENAFLILRAHVIHEMGG